MKAPRPTTKEGSYHLMTAGRGWFASAASNPTPQSHQKTTVHASHSTAVPSITTLPAGEGPWRVRQSATTIAAGMTSGERVPPTKNRTGSEARTKAQATAALPLLPRQTGSFANAVRAGATRRDLHPGCGGLIEGAPSPPPLRRKQCPSWRSGLAVRPCCPQSAGIDALSHSRADREKGRRPSQRSVDASAGSPRAARLTTPTGSSLTVHPEPDTLQVMFPSPYIRTTPRNCWRSVATS